MKILFSAAIVAALALVHPAPATAGPIEDAIAAYDRQDYEEAIRILEPLALEGDARAQSKLAWLYYGGSDDEQRKSFMLWQKAAAQGLAEAQFYLGHVYYSGMVLSESWEELVPVDRVRGLELFHKAAEQGYVAAKLKLGNLLMDTRDFAGAAKWFLSIAEAAEPGSADFYLSANALGEAYNRSDNYTEALKWHQAIIQTAEPGSYEFYRAAENIGYTYLSDPDTPNRYMMAHMWYGIAVEFGGQDNYDPHGFYKALSAQNAMAEHLTPEQIAEAQAMAEGWMKTHKAN